MQLFLCDLCGKAYDPHAVLVDKGICKDCTQELDSMYAGIHSLIVSIGEMDKLNLEDVSRRLEIDMEDIKILYDLGYFERDIQTYCRTPSERQILAQEFERELKLLIERNKITTYGGIVYNRKDKEIEGNIITNITSHALNAG